jgi:hypothetical protein
VEAYYWISLECRCVDPRSIGGGKSWTKREDIAAHLSLVQLEHLWRRIDVFMAQVDAGTADVSFAPFLHGMIDPQEEAEGRRLAQEREDEHRQRWRASQR